MKLRNKLILSCAALAAVATTAVSTTFAWYTANDSVKANGITGATNDKDTTLLLISKTGKVGSWGASVDIDTSKVVLEPVTYNNGNYYGWDSEENAPLETPAVAGGDGAQAGDYISFYLYFKSGSSTSLDVTIDSFTLTNTSVAALPHFSVLAEGTGSTENYYTVDLFRALNVVLYTDQGKEVAKTASSPTIGNAAERVAYECDSLATAKTQSSTAGDNIDTSTANAHTYYNNVKSLDPGIDDSIESSEDDLEDVADLNGGDFVFSLPTGAGAQSAAETPGLDNILMVRFDIYLDGWDKFCFDACRKQSFTLNMEFSGGAHTGA